MFMYCIYDTLCLLNIYINEKIYIYIYIYLFIYIYLEPDPCFGWKRPCFGGLTFKNRGHWGSRYIYIFNIYIYTTLLLGA